jgi:hypothetical protein
MSDSSTQMIFPSNLVLLRRDRRQRILALNIDKAKPQGVFLRQSNPCESIARGPTVKVGRICRDRVEKAELPI